MKKVAQAISCKEQMVQYFFRKSKSYQLWCYLDLFQPIKALVTQWGRQMDPQPALQQQQQQEGVSDKPLRQTLVMVAALEMQPPQELNQEGK